MNTLRTRTLTLAGLLLAGLAVLTQAPAAARGDGADWQDPDYQSWRHIQDQIIGGNHPGYGPAVTQLYAAVAYSPSTGRYGWAKGYATLQAARQGAVEACNEPDARPVIWAPDGRYFALAAGKDGAAGATATTAVRAKAIALQECSEHTTDCKILYCFYAGD